MPAKIVSPKDALETSHPFDGFCYKRGGLWVPLPKWANFYLRLGETLSRWNDEQSRFTVALAVPIHSYISPLISAGIISGRSIIPCIKTDPEYFDFLSSLPEDTPLIYREKNRKRNAKKKEVREINGKRYLGIQIDEGITNTIQYFTPEKVRLIELSNKDYVKLPRQQKGRKITPPSQLVTAILSETCVYDFLLHTRLENVIIGSSTVLKEELQTALAATRLTQGDCPGLLADLLRVRELNPPGTAYRTSILAAANNKISSNPRKVSPYIVIFDGSLGFVKWRDYWRQFNWVVILEHTDPNFHYAVDQVNLEYHYRSEKPHKVKIPPLPPGIEMMFFITDL